MRCQLTEDIKTVIGKHLTAEAGDLLRERLELAVNLEEENAGLKDILAGYRKELAAVRENIVEQATLDVRGAAQSDVARALAVREVKLDHAEAINHLKVESAGLRLADMRETLKLIFGNRVIRETVQESAVVGEDERIEPVFGTTVTEEV